MNKKGTQAKSRLANRKKIDYSFDQIFNNSMYELFHPKSNAKLIDYAQLNLVDWNQLKLIDHRQLNLVNLSVLSLFLQYIGAVVFVFLMVFALPIRIYLDSALTMKYQTESYLYTQTLIDQQNKRNKMQNLATRVLNGKYSNENIAVVNYDVSSTTLTDNNISQSDLIEGEPTHKEFTLTPLTDFSFDVDLASLSNQQSAIPGNVLGVNQVVNVIDNTVNQGVSEYQLVSSQNDKIAVLVIDQNSVFSDQSDQSKETNLHNTEHFI